MSFAEHGGCEDKCPHHCVCDHISGYHIPPDNLTLHGIQGVSAAQHTDYIIVEKVHHSGNPDIPGLHICISEEDSHGNAGNDLCCRLGAVMTDPVGQPIGPAVATMICRQLSEMYEQMAVSGVSAGSLRARRIFSRI